MIVGWMRWDSATVSNMVAIVLPTGSFGSYSMRTLCIAELVNQRGHGLFGCKGRCLGLCACSLGPEMNDGFAHGVAMPLAQVDLVAVEVGDGGAVDLSGDEDDEFFAELHQVVVVGVGLVELEHGELGVVAVLMPSLRKLRLIS